MLPKQIHRSRSRIDNIRTSAFTRLTISVNLNVVSIDFDYDAHPELLKYS
jgi:hypothetical protein